MTRLVDYRQTLTWALQDAGAPESVIADLGRLLDALEDRAERARASRRVAALVATAQSSAKLRTAIDEAADAVLAVRPGLDLRDLVAITRRKLRADPGAYGVTLRPGGPHPRTLRDQLRGRFEEIGTSGRRGTGSAASRVYAATSSST